MSTKLKSTKSGGDPVADFMVKLKHPLKAEIEAVRKIIHRADPSLTEQIKWNAPSFCKDGDDRITLNLTGKGFIRLIFHRGAKVKDSNGKGRLFEDKTGLLEWAADDRAIAKFTSMADVKEKEKHLIATVKKWISLT